MENASEAAAALDAGKDGGLELAPEVEQKGTVSLLEGEDEKTYYVSTSTLVCGVQSDRPESFHAISCHLLVKEGKHLMARGASTVCTLGRSCLS